MLIVKTHYREGNMTPMAPPPDKSGNYDRGITDVDRENSLSGNYEMGKTSDFDCEIS
jgi:hypothetical protein